MSTLQKNGFINFPRQKTTTHEKLKNDRQWFKDCVDYAENLINTDMTVRRSFDKKRRNYNLRSNIINKKDFEKVINPDKIDLDTLPAEFQHIGIENSKINLLVGEYVKRRRGFIASVSNKDGEAYAQKEQERRQAIEQGVLELFKSQGLSEEQMAQEMERLVEKSFDKFKSTAERIANRILERETEYLNVDFTQIRTFEDGLISGEQINHIDILGGEPVYRRVDPRNLQVIGGHGMDIENASIILEYTYESATKVIDDYFDLLSDEDVEYLETGISKTGNKNLGLTRDFSIAERFGEDAELYLFNPSDTLTRQFSGGFDTDGRVRVIRVTWRSKRKIGKCKYWEDGVEQMKYVPDTYVPNKNEGEEVDWMWVNEWMQGTKIGTDIYLNMKPVTAVGKSLTNLSKGMPPYIGTLHSTAGEEVRSLTDVMAPLSFAYDLAFWKRELAIATFKGNIAYINSSMIPSGMDPKEYMRYITINKFAWLDPTNEILKGPSQGKSAGAFNTVTAGSIPMSDASEIQMYTNQLYDIEATLGKIAGVSGAREGQIQNREAVGNTEREITQTSHITEKFFRIDAYHRKKCIEKLLEVCKICYLENPERSQYLLDEFEISTLEELYDVMFKEFDVNITDSADDKMVLDKVKEYAQAAMQNAQATIADLAEIETIKSTSDAITKLRRANEKIQQQQERIEQQKTEAAERMQQAQLESQKAGRDWEIKKHEDEMALKHRELDVKIGKEAANIEGDLDKNGIKDQLDRERTEAERQDRQEKNEIAKMKVKEEERHNKATEKIDEKKVEVDKMKAKQASKSPSSKNKKK